MPKIMSDSVVRLVTGRGIWSRVVGSGSSHVHLASISHSIASWWLESGPADTVVHLLLTPAGDLPNKE